MEEFYFENIQPNANLFEHNPSFDEAMRTIEENETVLLKLLPEKEGALFLDYCNAWSIVNGHTAVEKFIGGFKIGAQMGIAIVSDDDGYSQKSE